MIKRFYAGQKGDVYKHLILFVNNKFSYFVKNGSQETNIESREPDGGVCGTLCDR